MYLLSSQFLGKAAVVTKVTVDEVVMTLALPSNELRFNVVKDALKKVSNIFIMTKLMKSGILFSA